MAAGDLWARLGNLQLFHNDDATAALAPYRAAVNCLSAGKKVDGAVLALARVAECHERLRDFDASLASLGEAHALAEKHHEPKLAAGALNQQAILLQELGCFDEACAVPIPSIVRVAIAQVADYHRWFRHVF